MEHFSAHSPLAGPDCIFFFIFWNTARLLNNVFSYSASQSTFLGKKFHFSSVHSLSLHAPNSFASHVAMHTRPSDLHQLPESCSNSCPSRWWCNNPFPSSVPFFLPPSIFPALCPFPKSHLHIKCQSAVSKAMISPSTNTQDWSPLGIWLCLDPCSPRTLPRAFS